MHLTWFGLSSFKIVSRDVTIFTDPFSKVSGATPPRGNADIVISSSPDNPLANNFSSISGQPYLIDCPGEYDIKGVFVHGVPAGATNDKQTVINRQGVYTITVEGLMIGFLGQYHDPALSPEQLELLDESDILLVPVGGSGSATAERAVKIINELEPKIVIPMHYQIPGFSLKLEGVEWFLKEFGGKTETLEKLSIKKSDLVEDTTRLILLSPQR